jgi:hypothetical protein
MGEDRDGSRPALLEHVNDTKAASSLSPSCHLLPPLSVRTDTSSPLRFTPPLR